MTDPTLPFDGQPIRVLLAEDNEEDWRKTCDLLKTARLVTFAIDRARGVEDALTRLGTNAYDVCLLEPRQPGGLTFVRAAHHRSFPAPIIILTALTTLVSSYFYLAHGGGVPASSPVPPVGEATWVGVATGRDPSRPRPGSVNCWLVG